LQVVVIKIEDIYVPTQRRKELDPERVELAAEKVMDEADQLPILVRRGKERYVLVKGVNRLEAHKALGEETIQALIVSARRS